eukprot:9814483-Alexandrium_andersonii.AAC.1
MWSLRTRQHTANAQARSPTPVTHESEQDTQGRQARTAGVNAPCLHHDRPARADRAREPGRVARTTSPCRNPCAACRVPTDHQYQRRPTSNQRMRSPPLRGNC